MRRWPVLAGWLIGLGGVQVVAVALLSRFFTQTEHGQLLDTIALTGNSIGRARVDNAVDTILNTISVVSLVVAVVVIGFIALIRRRIAVAIGATLLIIGASVTAQVLQAVITRPELGVDMERAAAGNSFPSGHATIAASVALAGILVLPARVRGLGAILGALFAGAAGVATLSAGWHRPSDAVAAMLIAGAWASAAGLFILVAQRPTVDSGRPNWLATVLLGLTGVALLVGAVVALELTEQVLTVPVDELSRNRLMAAYGGGALGIAGMASLVTATVLATAYRVVPELPASQPVDVAV